MRALSTLLIAGTIVLSGCGKTETTLAGGKPVTHWVQAMKDPDARVRKTAAFKLGNVGPMDETSLPSLLEGLKDTDAGVRCEAILAIVKFGPAAQEAVPALTNLQKDRDARVRSHATRALESISANR